MSAPPPRASTPEFFSTQTATERRFYLDLSPQTRTALSVVAGGFEQCTPNYEVRRDHFPYHALELVTAGEGTVELAGRLHPLAAGRVFSYGPAVPHVIRCDPRYPMEKYFVTFHGSEAPRLLAGARLPPGACGDVPRLANVRSIWDELLRAGVQPADRAREHTRLGLRFLAAVLGDGSQGSPRVGRAYATWHRCEAYLQQHFLQLRTVQEVADACHVDLPYLCRLSRRFQGQSPFHYLQRLQMGWAAERLRQQRLVREVADELRIDPFQFSRTFKRIHGVAPSEFQRLHAG